MKQDFYALQKAIMDFITSEYPAIAQGAYRLAPVDKAVMSFPNFDRERGSKKIVFFDFARYTVERLTLESSLVKGSCDIYITLRGSDAPEMMSGEIAKYSTVFFSLIEEHTTLGGVVDYAGIEEIELYEKVEGNMNYKAAVLKMRFEKEYD